MKLNKYDAFLKILECGSFTVAAEELNYTQSAVSQMISSLEKELETTLFVRSRRSLQLTYEGEQLLPLIRKLVQDEQLLKEKALELKGMQAGIVRMATFATFSGSLLPHILKAFQKSYPHVVFELHQGYYREIEQWVERDVVDFGITNIDGVKKYHCQALFEDPLYVVLPPGHRLEKEKTIAPQQLKGEVFVVMDEGDDRDFLNLLEQQDISLDIRYRLCDDNSILSMVENGMGIAILPQLAVLAGRRHLAHIPLEPPICRTIGVIKKQKRKLSPTSQMFLHFMKEHIKEQEAGQSL